MLPVAGDRPTPLLACVRRPTSDARALKDGPRGAEAISGKVFCGSSRVGDGRNVGLDDRVVDAVNHRVDSKTEDVLMVFFRDGEVSGLSVITSGREFNRMVGDSRALTLGATCVP